MSEIQPIARALGRTVDLERAGAPPAGIPLACTACDAPVHLVHDPVGIVHDAPADHDPETRAKVAIRRMLARAIRGIFPSAAIARCEPIPDARVRADIIVVSPHGVRLAVMVISRPWSRREIQEATARLEGSGIAVLWVISSDLFRPSRAGRHARVNVTLDAMMTWMIQGGRGLLFADPSSRELIVIHPHPVAQRLAALGEARIGRVECLVRRYPVSQLRFDEGMACVLTAYDPDAPLPGQAPAALLHKLATRRAQREGDSVDVTASRGADTGASAST